MRGDNRALRHVAGVVSQLKVGENIVFDHVTMMDIQGFEHNGAYFSPADRVLENVVGSAWTTSYLIRPDASVEFVRHPDDGTRKYISPDQRDRMDGCRCASPTSSRTGGSLRSTQISLPPPAADVKEG